MPRTFNRQRRMEPGQLRFWSLCTGESRVTVRTPDCVADRELPVDSARRFTVVVSRKEDRPLNATERCGVGWIDWGDRGDGAGDPDYAVLILRNMLPAAGFAQAVQRVRLPGTEPDVMGAHFPATSYGTEAGFEQPRLQPQRAVPRPAAAFGPARAARARAGVVRVVRGHVLGAPHHALGQAAGGPRPLPRALGPQPGGHVQALAQGPQALPPRPARRGPRRGGTPVGVPVSDRVRYRLKRRR